MSARKRKLLPPAQPCEHLNATPKQMQQDQEERRSQYFASNAENGARLRFSFFSQPSVDLAKAFLGKVLVRRHCSGTELRGRVVETEAYLGGEDKASHSAGGKRTERNAAMFMKPGTVYVYPIYGIYLCMNVSSQGEVFKLH
ncbi:hypothetical protein AOLI_G00307220 [Acnodon oligacanthus]